MWNTYKEKMEDLGDIENIAMRKTAGYDDDFANSQLMQFTGLKDKNGKEIYEGDIIKYCFWNDVETNLYREWKIGKIFWDNEHAKFDVDGSIMGLFGWDKYYEVIGNIYETPELLTLK